MINLKKPLSTMKHFLAIPFLVLLSFFITFLELFCKDVKISRLVKILPPYKISLDLWIKKWVD